MRKINKESKHNKTTNQRQKHKYHTKIKKSTQTQIINKKTQQYNILKQQYISHKGKITQYIRVNKIYKKNKFN